MERSWTGLFTQLMQCVRVDVCLTRIEKKQDGIVGLSIDRSESTGGEGIEWLSVVVTQGLRRTFFFSPTFTADWTRRLLGLTKVSP